jgi:3-dehydroquinate dehydratase-2
MAGGYAIKVIHGANLNLLGMRQPNIYGNQTLNEINQKLEERAKRMGISLAVVQSNVEGEIVNEIHKALDTADAIIINPGAYTHYSLAIRDAISAVRIPTIEVHLTNIFSREEFRQTSVVSPVAAGVITGFGAASYTAALDLAKELLDEGRKF